MKKIFFVFWIVALFNFPCAIASSDKTMIGQVETFLNGIQCLVAEFLQTNPDHSQTTGKIWIKRQPKGMGKMRLDYSPEVQQRLIAKNGELIVYDLKDGSDSRYTLDYTPAAFILKPRIRLGIDVVVESVRKETNFIEIVLTPKGDATGQALTLYFSLYETGNIKNLEQWVVQDPQGNQTLVQFIPDKITLNDPTSVPEPLFTP
jgi:outer membrane lipoprotein-sorting protein